MEQSLKKEKILQGTQYEIDGLNNPVTIKKIGLIIFKFSPEKSLGPEDYTR